MTAYQIPHENDQRIQSPNVELQQQLLQDCSRKRVRTLELDESDDSLTPPEKTIRLHESISDGIDYLINTSRDPEKELDEQISENIVDISKLSKKEILSAYKRIWNNLDLNNINKDYSPYYDL
ncbi:hypothetical protein PS6_010250 [Mucor atramentarius]